MVPAIRLAVWLKTGDKFYKQCYIKWCSNVLNPFSFQIGHDIPKSKNGSYHIDNLFPICSTCNISMSNKYTIQEWQTFGNSIKFSTKNLKS